MFSPIEISLIMKRGRFIVKRFIDSDVILTPIIQFIYITYILLGF